MRAPPPPFLSVCKNAAAAPPGWYAIATAPEVISFKTLIASAMVEEMIKTTQEF
jgi:hypothetical protein